MVEANEHIPGRLKEPGFLWGLQTRLRAAEVRRFGQLLTEGSCDQLDILLEKSVPDPSRRRALRALPCVADNDLLRSSLGSEARILTRWDVESLTGRIAPPCVPLSLAILGNPQVLLAPKVAIVGTRHPTYYGRCQARRFGAYLAASGVTVVSGGAIGVDTLANGAALCHGASVAVLGSGFLHLHPRSNQRLFRDISRSPAGLLVTEFAPDVEPARWTFPRRNITIAWLADFVVVVEGAADSGSLITAEAALDHHCDVGAVPGPIDSSVSAGPNRLIRDGALCVCSPADVLDHLMTLPQVRRQGWSPRSVRDSWRDAIVGRPPVNPMSPANAVAEPG